MLAHVHCSRSRFLSLLCLAFASLCLLAGCTGSPTTSGTPKPTASVVGSATASATPTTPASSASTIYVGSADHSLYALNASDGRVRWKFQTGDAITSQPVIADGRVYVASTDHFVYAVSAATGQQVWRAEVGWYPSLSPVVNGTLFVSADPGVWALDAVSGTVRWHNEELHNAQTPVVAGGLVYVSGVDSGVDVLLALGMSDGVVRWHFSAGSYTQNFFNTPVIVSDTLYASNGNGYVYAFGASDGSLRWKTQLIHVVPGLSPLAVADGVVYVGGGNSASDYRLFALSAANGGSLWSAKTDGYISTPRVSGGTLYLKEHLYNTGDGIDTYCYALHATDGSQIWRAPLGLAMELVTSMLMLTPPVLMDGTIYVGSDDHGIYALNASGGSMRWRTDVNRNMSALLVAS
ncbi:MAG TPA: PQQ-binding-like beta-propeller repeat protein [Ktedonobacterales bacterium]